MYKPKVTCWLWVSQHVIIDGPVCFSSWHYRCEPVLCALSLKSSLSDSQLTEAVWAWCGRYWTNGFLPEAVLCFDGHKHKHIHANIYADFIETASCLGCGLLRTTLLTWQIFCQHHCYQSTCISYFKSAIGLFFHLLLRDFRPLLRAPQRHHPTLTSYC